MDPFQREKLKLGKLKQFARGCTTDPTVDHQSLSSSPVRLHIQEPPQVPVRRTTIASWSWASPQLPST